MILDKYTPCNAFEIWSRRYHDNKVLLAAHKVGAHNKVTFTKDPTMGTIAYYISGNSIKKYKKESNGKIMVYAVPTDELELLEINYKDIRSVI